MAANPLRSTGAGVRAYGGEGSGEGAMNRVRLAFAMLTAVVVARSAAAQVPPRCATPPQLRAISDLRFGRLVMVERGGTAELIAGPCTVSEFQGVQYLQTADSGCAEFELDGGSANANQVVAVEVRNARTVSYAGGAGRAQVLNVTVADASGRLQGGGGGVSTVRLDAAGRSRLRVGARLSVVEFASGELRTPITLAANYLGCPR